jgi:glycosyltransferase involved in cell wall biosynthesis
VTSPRFSIIMPHYQGSIDHDTFLRGVNSILNQTCKDFEIICIHDGPLLTKEEFPVEVICTKKRYNDWGHSLRDWGIKKAKGEYIIHFNPDNVLYPDCLEVLSTYSDDVLVFAVKMMGMIAYVDEQGQEWKAYPHERDYSIYTVITGNPVRFNNIDCMQLVAKRWVWHGIGGWKDKREVSDFILYEEIGLKHPPKFISEVLGEHY